MRSRPPTPTPRSRTTRSASAWTAGAVRSGSRAWTTPAPTIRRWKIRWCISMNGSDGESGHERMSTLVSTDELAQHPDWRMFDCRHDLANPALGEQQYLEAHIPGALFAHLDRDLSAATTGDNGRHPLPEAKTFIGWLGRQGLKPADMVVCYDGGG